MVSFKEFNINLKALNHGNTVFHYAITDDFFHFVEALDIIGGDLQAEVVVLCFLGMNTTNKTT